MLPASALPLDAPPADSPESDQDILPLHEVPASIRAGVWVAAAVMLAVLGFVYAIPITLRGNAWALLAAYPASIIVGLATFHFVKTALALRTGFIAAPEGLHVLPRAGEPELVRWSSVVGIRQRPHLQRIELRTAAGRTIALEYQLSDFDALAGALLRLAPTAALCGAGGDAGATPDSIRSTFRSSRARVLLLPIAAIALGGSIAVYGGILILAWVIAVMCAWTWLAGWHAIRIEPDALVVQRAFRSRRIPAAHVIGSQFVMERHRKGHRAAVVIAPLIDGDVLRLTGVREGELSLQAALQRWHGR